MNMASRKGGRPLRRPLGGSELFYSFHNNSFCFILFCHPPSHPQARPEKGICLELLLYILLSFFLSCLFKLLSLSFLLVLFLLSYSFFIGALLLRPGTPSLFVLLADLQIVYIESIQAYGQTQTARQLDWEETFRSRRTDRRPEGENGSSILIVNIPFCRHLISGYLCIL